MTRRDGRGRCCPRLLRTPFSRRACFRPPAHLLTRLLAVSVFLPLLFSCAGNPPHILQVASQLLYVKDLSGPRVYEQLSLFLQAEDEDGEDDLEFAYLINDTEELYWTLDSQTWRTVKVDKEQWIGSNRLSMPGNLPFPRGEYRILLVDLGGDSDERSLTLDASPLPAVSTIPFPRVELKEGKLSVLGVFSGYTLLVYTPQGEYVKSMPVRGKPLSVAAVKRGSPPLRNGFSFSIYTYWKRKRAGLLVGPYFSD